ncbi:TetR/AcrR family transcriptional regulator [Acidobacteria bacterium AB60]|nr:TetR/AcrR family transcriptional regulator [Acidobacteria bacterium AB60]
MVRPRSLEAHEKVIHAALSLFGERGIEATSMDAIARASGVSKATIYNHWSDKEALLLEVMLYVNGLNKEPEDVDTGDLERDLATILSRRPPGEFAEARDRMMPTLIAYSAVHPEFGSLWRRRVMEPPQRCLKQVLRRGIDRGQLSPDLDLELAMALLLGPMLFTHVFSKSRQQPGRDIGPETAAAFTRAHAIRKAVAVSKHLESLKSRRS